MKIVRSAAVTIVAAGSFTLLGAGNSFAIDEVQCNPQEDFTKITSHDGGGTHVNCYANAGQMYFGAWVDRVEAGNNTVFLYDANGDVLEVPKWQTLVRNTPADITHIEIK